MFMVLQREQPSVRNHHVLIVYPRNSGDSWRARVTHICELQFNMSYLGMKIDFGGLDRWDYSERRRNLDEANMDIA